MNNFVKRFEDQVAVVTGGASGIGEGIATRLAMEGAQVVILDSSVERLEKVVAEMRQNKLEVSGKALDVADEVAVKSAFEATIEEFGRLDITVACAGVVGPSSCSISEYSATDFDRTIAVNLRGAFLATKYSIAPMLKHRYGRILHLCSIGGKEGNPGMVGYAASKSGVMGLVKSVGKEYAEKGITVNGLAPAVISTPMNSDTDPKMLEYMKSRIPMNRLGTVEEATSLACWIVSKEASFNTGFIFDLSGGRATY